MEDKRGHQALEATTALIVGVLILVPGCREKMASSHAVDLQPGVSHQPDDYLGRASFRGLRTFISTTRRADCHDLTSRIDRLYETLNVCTRDADCTMFMPCDAINERADLKQLQSLLDERDRNGCETFHGPCRRSEVAVCRGKRCVARYVEE